MISFQGVVIRKAVYIPISTVYTQSLKRLQKMSFLPSQWPGYEARDKWCPFEMFSFEGGVIREALPISLALSLLYTSTHNNHRCVWSIAIYYRFRYSILTLFTVWSYMYIPLYLYICTYVHLRAQHTTVCLCCFTF